MKKDLNSTISEWAATDTQEPDVKQSVPFSVTNNVSRATFNTIRDNPGKGFKEVVDILLVAGYKKSSVSSLIAQLLRGGQVVKDVNGKLYTVNKEYVPLKSYTALKKKAEKRSYVKKADLVSDSKAGIAALKTHTKSAEVKQFNPDQLLATLSFPQVMELYKKIKTMLGEA